MESSWAILHALTPPRPPRPGPEERVAKGRKGVGGGIAPDHLTSYRAGGTPEAGGGGPLQGHRQRQRRDLAGRVGSRERPSAHTELPTFPHTSSSSSSSSSSQADRETVNVAFGNSVCALASSGAPAYFESEVDGAMPIGAYIGITPPPHTSTWTFFLKPSPPPSAPPPPFPPRPSHASDLLTPPPCNSFSCSPSFSHLLRTPLPHQSLLLINPQPEFTRPSP